MNGIIVVVTWPRPRQPYLAVGGSPLCCFACLSQGADLAAAGSTGSESARPVRAAYSPRRNRRSTETRAAPETPGAGMSAEPRDQIAAQRCASRGGVRQPALPPSPVPRLDAGPFILRQHLAVEGGSSPGWRSRPACLGGVPEANVFLRTQMAGHHEEVERQFADVRIAPVGGARPRLHQQIVHLLQITLGFVEPGCQRRARAERSSCEVMSCLYAVLIARFAGDVGRSPLTGLADVMRRGQLTSLTRRAPPVDGYAAGRADYSARADPAAGSMASTPCGRAGLRPAVAEVSRSMSCKWHITSRTDHDSGRA